MFDEKAIRIGQKVASGKWQEENPEPELEDLRSFARETQPPVRSPLARMASRLASVFGL